MSSRNLPTDSEPNQESPSLSLNDLPAEIINEIAQHLRSERVPPAKDHCRCGDFRRWTKIRPAEFDLSTAHAFTYFDPSWAFACVSRRYRIIVFHGDKDRKLALVLNSCSVKRALKLPASFRKSVTRVHLLGSHVCEPAYRRSRNVERRECCGECADCEECDICGNSQRGIGRPQDLSDVLALFPNTADLTVDLQVPDATVFKFRGSIKHSSAQLRQLTRLTVALDSEDLDHNAIQAIEARRLVDSLHLPSVEYFSIEFVVSEDGRGYVEDFEAIREALCGIDSPKLRDVKVAAKMPICSSTFPRPWPVIEYLISTVVEHTNITSFTFDINYELDNTIGIDWKDFFIETSKGARVSPLIVPNKAGFTKLFRQIATICKDGRSDCSVQITMEGEIQCHDYLLLQADYHASHNTTPTSSVESRITYYFKQAVLDDVKAILVDDSDEKSDSGEEYW